MPTAEENRSALLAALEADLIGPFYPRGSSRDEVLPLPPSRWYWAGFLAPYDARETEDPTSDDEGGAGSDEDDGESAGQEQEPKQKKAFSASLHIGPAVRTTPHDRTRVRVCFADYVPESRESDGVGPPRKVWRRVARGPIELDLPLDASALERGIALPGHEDVALVKVMARLFRRLFRHALLKAIDAGEVNVPTELVEPMRRALFDKKWVVYAKAPFGGAEQVDSYLGRYTHRVEISNARILRVDERSVTFATKDGRTCTLEPVEFLRRLLLHVLPKGFDKIRHYGLCSSHHVAIDTIGKVRNMLEGPSNAADSAPCSILPDEHPAAAKTELTAPESWVECMLALTGLAVMRCPRCTHGRLWRVALSLTTATPIENSS